jgi:probable HAF family extracellular repeat protein
MIGLGVLSGGFFFSEANAISADGTTVVGVSRSSLSNTGEAFRWTAATGMVGLGDSPGGPVFSEAFAVSADGSVIVGRSDSSTGLEASIWDATNGMRSLESLLVAEGVTDVNGWALLRATGVSGDGRTIVGFGINPSGQTEAWLARLGSATSVPEPSAGLLLGTGLIVALHFSRRCKKVSGTFY